MIAPELSRYPASYDEDQQLLAEQLYRRREEAIGFMGSLAMATVTAGILEPAPAKIETTPQLQPSEEVVRSYGSRAISPMLMHSLPVDRAVAYQAAYELAA